MINYKFYIADRMTETVSTVEFATNNTGEGLFQWFGGELKQQSGNGQFYASNENDMLRKINRIYSDDYTRYFKTERGATKFSKS